MRTLALIGKHLQHSFSQKYFFEKFKQLGLTNFEYINIELNDIADLKLVLETNKNIEGFNVTMPFKQLIMPLLTEVDVDALSIGAVNTVKVVRKTNSIFLKGYNTDAYGFKFSIKPFLTLNHQKALVLGTGGASKAVAHVLNNLGIDVLFVSRNIKNRNTILYSDLNDYAIAQYKLIVNCTPMGMFPNINDKLNFETKTIGKEHLCVDLIYNPTKTVFLKQAETNGAAILNGLSMLHLQAEKAFEIFMKE